MEFHADVLELGSSLVGARLNKSSAFVARRRSPIWSMQSVERKTCEWKVLLPHLDDALKDSYFLL